MINDGGLSQVFAVNVVQEGLWRGRGAQRQAAHLAVGLFKGVPNVALDEPAGRPEAEGGGPRRGGGIKFAASVQTSQEHELERCP